MNSVINNIFHFSLFSQLKCLFKKISAHIAFLKSFILLNSVEKKFIKTFIQEENATDNSSKKKLSVAIQMPEDYFYLILFSLVIKFLKLRYKVEINWINVNCEFQRKGRFEFLKRSSFYERKWSKLYLSNGGEVAFSNLVYEKDISKSLFEYSEKVFQGFKSKDDVVDFCYKDIILGDLIYDTYLRFKPAATVDIKDPFLFSVVNSAVHIFEKADLFLKEKKIEYIFTSYCSYIHHGILVRLALKHNMKVISFGSYDQLAKIVTESYPSHIKDYTNYRELFEALDSNKKQENRKISEKKLNERFSGGIDSSTYYMKKSAFGDIQNSETKIFKETGKKRAVIFLHCFFDSPHIHRYMHYSDFYEWITNILSIASESDFDFYVKSHPNAIEGNKVIVEELKKKFPKINFIPAQTSNSVLISQGFDAAFTVYGTLGHEFPFFKIPVVNAGDNPHINYSFCINTKSKEEYEWYVKNIDKIPSVSEAAKESILEFYYMHSDYSFPGKNDTVENGFLNSEIRFIDTSSKLQKFLDKWTSDQKYKERVETVVFQSLKAVL